MNQNKNMFRENNTTIFTRCRIALFITLKHYIEIGRTEYYTESVILYFQSFTKTRLYKLICYKILIHILTQKSQISIPFIVENVFLILITLSAFRIFKENIKIKLKATFQSSLKIDSIFKWKQRLFIFRIDDHIIQSCK